MPSSDNGFRAALLLSFAALSACAGSPRRPGAPASRGAGCFIEIVREGVPTRPTHRLGEAVARCQGSLANDEAACTRQLSDHACELGATLLWDVRSQEADEGVRIMRGVAGVYRE